jgi:hypothetical protein
MSYKNLNVLSYARSASNFIVYNSLSICPEININKESWHNLDRLNKDNVYVSVLRNPSEAIVSDLAMSLNDTITNISDVYSLDYSVSINSFKMYIDLLNKNIDNIMPFTFEQITENPEKSFRLFLGSCGYREEFNFPDIEIKEKTVFNSSMKKTQKFIPTSKFLQIYNEIREYTEAKDIFVNLIKDYNECKYNIYFRQLDF